MPELPETETIARDLDRSIRGRRIEKVTVRKPDVLRGVTVRALGRRLRGASIVRSWRRAKLVVLDLDTGDRIVVQPRFTGALLVDSGQFKGGELNYSTMKFELDDARSLHYSDVRRLGTVALMSQNIFDAYSGKLGIEPLDRAFTGAHLSGVLRVSSQPVKKVLMEQRKIAGIGNIYANEALWRARIDPSRPAVSVTAEQAQTLRDSIVAVLNEAIEARGTSFRDYRDAQGERGSFVEQLAAYGRGGLPCPRCGSRLVTTHAVDGRATTLCIRCQS
ncbi:MAG TPA: bifunctional DNA-formamidopyrimidine glycosylase/DNA-(apurinic or apyrimidinic site) lyase [Gemmatimonadaceae bacterium]|nr:bifunctional DNA-formamidopyrimidine glycosylase/DNA-(apurinic or apyrimidinic site) lyase [Gemmatimonadaceae bacterium]